jgi:hypothetical protein
MMASTSAVNIILEKARLRPAPPHAAAAGRRDSRVAARLPPAAAMQIASKDKDFRWMATSDLLNELSKDGFVVDAELEKKLCSVVAVQLEDTSGDISGLAVKWWVAARRTCCSAARMPRRPPPTPAAASHAKGGCPHPTLRRARSLGQLVRKVNEQRALDMLRALGDKILSSGSAKTAATREVGGSPRLAAAVGAAGGLDWGAAWAGAARARPAGVLHAGDAAPTQRRGVIAARPPSRPPAPCRLQA